MVVSTFAQRQVTSSKNDLPFLDFGYFLEAAGRTMVDPPIHLHDSGCALRAIHVRVCVL